MDFVQSMGLSRVTRNILNNAISGSSIGKIAAVTNSKLEKEWKHFFQGFDFAHESYDLDIKSKLEFLSLNQ